MFVLNNRLAIGPSAHMAFMQYLCTKTQEEILCDIPLVHMAKNKAIC